FGRAPRGVSTTTWTSSCPAQAGSLARFGIAIRTDSRGSAGASLSAQRILHAANGVADFPADLVGFSFPFELLVAGCLAGDLLDLAFGLLSRTLDAILVHCMPPIGVTGEQGSRRQGPAGLPPATPVRQWQSRPSRSPPLP